MQLDNEPVAHATGINLPPSGLKQFGSFLAQSRNATTPIFEHSRFTLWKLRFSPKKPSLTILALPPYLPSANKAAKQMREAFYGVARNLTIYWASQ